MTGIIDDLLTGLPSGNLLDIRIGAFWTAVVVETGGQRSCGLAATLRGFAEHHYGGGPAVADAGRLLDRTPTELAQLARSTSLMEASIGFAAINALLSPQPQPWVDLNAEEVIARHGAGKKVALVGHFPFVPRLREIAGTLWVLELDPREDDLPATAAAEVIPQADIVAITGTTLLNHTFDSLMALRKPDALTLVLGPSTPPSPRLFNHGVHLISTALVEDVDSVLRAVCQGANFRQIRRQGVRLVTLPHPDHPGL